MLLSPRSILIFVLGVCSNLQFVHAQEEVKQLTSSQLLALVAGESLPESIAQDIHTRGLAFKPFYGYREILLEAGADPKVLIAFDKATPGTVPDATPPKSLQHLATAGKLLRSKNYDGAARELTDALEPDEGTAAGFVMGTILIKQERYAVASSVYAKVLERDPDFPEAHTKFSFALYKCADAGESLRQAKAAIAESPKNPEAHKNAGNALLVTLQYEAALAEFNEALRTKPDYESARYDIGYTLYVRGDLDAAIVEFKKAIALDPSNVDAHFFLGASFKNKQQFQDAIPELREAKRLDPNRFETRMNLGDALYESQMYGEAVHEFRDLVVLFPDNSMAHRGLGLSYAMVGNEAAAEKEYRLAADLDPSDAMPLLNLGYLLESQGKSDEALDTYRRAEKASEKSELPHVHIGAMLLARKDYAGALRELKRAEALNPGLAWTHDLYARALLASGETDQAIDEFKQSIALDTRDAQVQLRLATALEQRGDWVAALEQYRQAATTDAGRPLEHRIVHGDDLDPQKEYKEAQTRYQRHLASLKASGKSSEAAKLESTLSTSLADKGLSAKLDASMQAGFAAMREGRTNDALQNYKNAVQIAAQMRVQDNRLYVALGEFGKTTLSLKRFDEANAIFQQQLKVAEQTGGPQSPAMIEPLENLGMNAAYQQHYDASRSYFTRGLELTKQNYGEKNSAVATVMHKMGWTYFLQQDYTNAEVWFLRAAKLHDELNGYDGFEGVGDIIALCALYDRAGKSDKSADCYAQLAAITEKRFGPNNSFLAQPLSSQAKALRSVGRTDEAARIEQRIKTLQTSTSN